MVFFLLSFLWYLCCDVRQPIRPEHLPDRRDSRFKIGFYAASLAAFLLAMLSKGSVAILPVILLLVTWWRYGKLTLRDFALSTPFFVISVGLTLVNIWFQTHGVSQSIRDVSLIECLLGAGAAIWFYLSKALLPVDLSFFYPQWHIDVVNVLWWLPFVFALAITVILTWRCNRPSVRPYFFAWAWFCVALLPAIDLTDVAYMRFSLVADHYQYIAILAR